MLFYTHARTHTDRSWLFNRQMAKAGYVGGSVEGCAWLRSFFFFFYLGKQECDWFLIKAMRETDQKLIVGIRTEVRSEVNSSVVCSDGATA